MNNTETNKKSVLKVRFIDKDRLENDTSYLSISGSIAFLTNAKDGVTIIFKERVSYLPGDKLFVKFADTPADSSTTEASTVN